MFLCDVTKRTLAHVMSFAGNYRLFAHSDVSYTFNGESDNVVLEFWLKFALCIKL